MYVGQSGRSSEPKDFQLESNGHKCFADNRYLRMLPWTLPNIENRVHDSAFVFDIAYCYDPSNRWNLSTSNYSYSQHNINFVLFESAIVILTMAVFFITPSTNAKLIVGMINLELISANLLYFHSTLPSGHVNKIPLIGKFSNFDLLVEVSIDFDRLCCLCWLSRTVSFYCGSLILTALSILTSIICLRWTRIPISSTPPVFVLKCLDGRVGRILGTNQVRLVFKWNSFILFKIKNYLKGTRTGATAPPVTSILSEKPQQNGSGANESRDDDAGIQHQWMTVFLALDRILTIVYCGCLGYFIIGYHLG